MGGGRVTTTVGSRADSTFGGSAEDTRFAELLHKIERKITLCLMSITPNLWQKGKYMTRLDKDNTAACFDGEETDFVFRMKWSPLGRSDQRVKDVHERDLDQPEKCRCTRPHATKDRSGRVRWLRPRDCS